MQPRYTQYILALALCSCIFSCQVDTVKDKTLDTTLKSRLNQVAPSDNYTYFQLPNPTNYDNLPFVDPSVNPMNSAKVELGKMLFYETAISIEAFQESQRGTYSCASCHIPEFGFTPGSPQGIADGGEGYGELRFKNNDRPSNSLDAQINRPLSVMNVTFVENTLWSGMFGSQGVNQDLDYGALSDGHPAHANEDGYPALETQNIEGFHIHRLGIDEEVLDSYGYREMFASAFPEDPNLVHEDPAKAFSFAVSAFLRTIVTTDAPFQRWLRNDNDPSFNDKMKRGALLFFGKANCSDCHNSPSLGASIDPNDGMDIRFHALGTKDMTEVTEITKTLYNEDLESEIERKLGRGGLNKREEDHYKFRVPQIYNTKDYQTYFHGSSKNSLEEVIEYKINAVSEKLEVENLSPLFVPLNLSNREIEDLLYFVEEGLYDPNMISKYVPLDIPSGQCFPNADETSIQFQSCLNEDYDY